MSDMGAVAIRLGLYLDLMALFGIAAFALYALRGEERRFDGPIALGPWLWGSAALGAALSLGGLAMLAASMAGVPLASVDLASIEMIVGGTSVGTAWLFRMAALLIALVVAFALRRWPVAALSLVTLAAAVALASLAWGGHGAMDDGAVGWLHLSADIAHLWAAGIWVGALLALLLLVFRRRELVDRDHLILSHRALDGFSLVGTITVGSIIVSGLINSWLLVGLSNILKLPESLYGQLLIAKLALFGAMAALATANRFRLVPAFERSLATDDHVGALSALRRSLTIETGCAIAVLALVAWLGTLEPSASAM
ncbi:copper homeostasis membrane protein CopD [Sphingomonas canadensis]|uniref:Copper homeostasis membrane protein CopD n=1 Tax=Sphingomonas canadensis TaxID=1219257 RepID=A0ABW3H9V7_9SPHN|nr:copper homeostasis membrane protein CopD [Sphingomonas canadensis]MCW3837277.1 copper homeostasis membrane protein CopD [Sphingomonas canadensis]